MLKQVFLPRLSKDHPVNCKRTTQFRQPDSQSEAEQIAGMRLRFRPGQSFPSGRGILIKNRKSQFIQVAAPTDSLPDTNNMPNEQEEKALFANSGIRERVQVPLSDQSEGNEWNELLSKLPA